MSDKIIIYQSADGKAALDVHLEQETVWLTQKQMAELFDVKVPAISKHVRNILDVGELDESATVSKMEKVQIEGGRQVKRRNISYNLDMIISIGYRVNSAKATKFRVWATKVVRDHLVQGYTINQQRLTEQAEKLAEMQQAVDLLTRTLEQQQLVSDLGKDVLHVISDYAYALNLLDRFDHGTLAIEKTSPTADFLLDYEAANRIVMSMKSDFSGLFGIEKDQGFKSALGTIYQTFDGKELYPSAEEKAQATRTAAEAGVVNRFICSSAEVWRWAIQLAVPT